MLTPGQKGWLTWLACSAAVVLVFLVLGPVIANRWLRMVTAGGVVVALAILVPALLVAFRSRSTMSCDPPDR